MKKEMTEERARSILQKVIKPNGDLRHKAWFGATIDWRKKKSWYSDPRMVLVNGNFDPIVLEAIGWWVQHQKDKP